MENNNIIDNREKNSSKSDKLNKLIKNKKFLISKKLTQLFTIFFR